MSIRRLPLQYWVPGVMVLLAFGLTAVAFVHDWVRTDRAVERMVLRQSTALGNLVVPGIERHLARQEAAEAEAEISRLLLNPHVVEARVLDETGGVILGSELRGQRDPGMTALVARVHTSRNAQVEVLYGRGVMRAGFPVALGLLPGELRSSRTAVLCLEFDMREPRRAEMAGIVRRSLAMGLATLVGCLAVSWHFHRRFTLRFNALVKGVDRYVEDPSALKVPVTGADEVARISRALQQMAADLERREGALRTSEARKAAILESTLDAFITLDPHGCVMDWNPAAVRILGHPASFAVGRELVELLLPRAQRSACRRELAAAMDTAAGEPCAPLEWTVETPGRTPYPVELSVAPVRVEPPLFAVFVRDLTERKQAEEALRRKDLLLREVINLVPHFIFAKDALGRFLFVNRATAETLGVGAQEVVGRTDAEIPVLAANAERYRRDDLEVLTSGRAKFVAAEVIQDHGGRPLLHQTTKIPFDDPVTGERALLGVAVDISDRMAAEEELRREAELRSAVIERVSEGICVCHEISAPPFVEFTIWNESMAEITGLTIDEINRLGCEAGLSPVAAGGGSFPDRARRMWRGENLKGEEWAVTRSDGRVRIVAVFTRVLESRDGVTHVLGLIHDLTDRRNAEIERARLATAMEQAAETILITDGAGQIEYVNPAFERITGYERQEVVGKSPKLLKSGAHDAAFYAHLKETLQRGETWKGRFVNRRKDGSLFEQEATISPVRNPAGQVVNYVEIARDITREVQLEAQLRHAQKMEAIGRLAGGVAHDFNNLLAVISMQAEMTEMNGGLPEHVADAFREIRGASDRAAALTRQLLLFSRRQVTQLKVVDLNEVVGNLTRMLQRLIGVEIQLRVEPAAGALRIRADVGMIDQVLVNLAVNARDAMPSGGALTLATRTLALERAGFLGSPPDQAEGDYAWLMVTDTGTGIAPEVLPRIFEPFFTTKAVGAGTGLGLATVFGIVRQHQGWIHVESTPGHGTSFHVFLPLEQEATPVREETPPRPASGGGEGVLLVEDDPGLRTTLTRVLQRRGYQVFPASDGASALAQWASLRSNVKVVLTDIQMPGGMNGRELARRLKAEAPDLKVILTSGYDAERGGADAVAAGAEVLLQKPVAVDDLLRALREALSPSDAGR